MRFKKDSKNVLKRAKALQKWKAIISKEPSLPWQNLKGYSVATSKKEASTSNPNPSGDTSRNSKTGRGVTGMPSEPNVGCFRSRQPQERSDESSKPNLAPNHPPSWRDGGRLEGESWARRCHLQLSHSLRHQSPGPRCHVPASVPASPPSTPGSEHILQRRRSSPPSRGPWRATPQTRAGRGQLERLEQLSPDWSPQNLAPARPGGASDTAPGPRRLPGDRPRRRRPGPAPRERPRTAGSPPMCQKRMFAAAPPTSPLRWPGQARPAAQLRSLPQPWAPLREPPRPAPPRHVRGCLGVRGHSVTHGGGVRSMRASARAARAGLWRAPRHKGRVGPARWRQAGGHFCAGAPRICALWVFGLRGYPKGSAVRESGSTWVRTCLPVFQPPRSFRCLCFCVPVYKRSVGSDFTSESTPDHPVEYQYTSPLHHSFAHKDLCYFHGSSTSWKFYTCSCLPPVECKFHES